MHNGISKLRILITGCAGSIGSKLIEKLTENETIIPTEIRGIDTFEEGLFELEQ